MKTRITTLKGNILEARSYWPRLIGVMGRKDWPKEHGGLYFPGCGAVHTFFTWARPDVLFLDSRKRVLSIHPKAGPWRLLTGPARASHCLELPPGTAKRLRLRPGLCLNWG